MDVILVQNGTQMTNLFDADMVALAIGVTLLPKKQATACGMKK